MNITSSDQIQRGDHIYFNRLAYSHHAIVEDVDYSEKMVTIIEYTTDPDEESHVISSNVLSSSMRKGKISKRTLRFGDPKLYKVLHVDSNTLENEEVIKRARSRIGEQQYGVFNNNCEHFANWCKEGDSKSGQARNWMIGLIFAFAFALIFLFW